VKNKYQININQEVLDDLRLRLAATIWPDEIANRKWETGTNKEYLQTLCDYWQNDFSWDKQQSFLNTFDHFTTTIDDNDIHFIHQMGEGIVNQPILLIHGWPDSFVRFLKLIPLLTKADKDGYAFDVIVPSIPGFGFSGIPKKEGMNPKKIADLFVELMTKELRYEKFTAHGGDWGSNIIEQLALYHENAVKAIHLTDVPWQHLFTVAEDELSQGEKKYLEEGKKWQQTEGGYASLQGTRPQSLAYGFTDSPAGLAGWLIEKFKSWSDNGGDIDNSFTKDELLTNATIYWATHTIGPSMRLYYEAMKALMQAKYNPLVKLNPFDKTDEKVNVPTAVAIFPKDIIPAPREYAERFYNIQRWTKMNKGGHFAAMEQPEDLAKDIRTFVKETIMMS